MLAGWAFQQAVYSVLSGVLAPVKLYDEVPPAAPYPYVVFGDNTVADESSKTEDGERHTLTIHVWSRAAGRRETKQIIGTISAALHRRVLAIPGYAPARVWADFATDMQDPDGVTRHGVVRFVALIQKVEG